MGEFFRSQKMSLIQLAIPFDVAHETVDELGRIGLVQFKDMNPELTAPQRAFVNDVKRIDEMERKLRFFHAQVLKFAPKYDRMDLLDCLHAGHVSSEMEKVEATPIPELESQFEDLERAIVELNQGEEGLKRMKAENYEQKYVLEIIRDFMEGSGKEAQAAPLLSGGGSSSCLTTIIGSIPRARRAVFERVIWRVTRGNIFFKAADIENPVEDPNTDEFVEKAAFLILTQGDYASDKIRKICEALGANTFDCPKTDDEQLNTIAELNEKMNDVSMILTQNAKGSEAVFHEIANNYNAWRSRVLKEKSIYHTMNLFKYNLGVKILVAEGWCPNDKFDAVRAATQRATNRSGSALPVSVEQKSNHNETPPTYFKTNKYTWAHQEIVDAYGVGRYQEINPTVFSIITFPFLFGVMFGDVGHGCIMLLFISLLIYHEDKFADGSLNEMIQTLYDGRYIIVLMAIFAIYNGFLYNECFSIPMFFGASQYGQIGTYPNDPGMMQFPKDPAHPDYRYPFGADPAWKGATNELYYYNSLKMKMSVLVGVTQMLLGIFLSGMNAIYRKKVYDFFFEFLPQMLFMLSIFGYLCFMIIFKWTVDYEPVINLEQPPSLLNTLVNMFLSPTYYSSHEDTSAVYDENPELYGENVAVGQQTVQIILLLLALICVPWMLLPKPFLLKRDHEKKMKGYTKIGDPGNVQGGVLEEEEEEEFEFQEVFIHQIIHTIEFVLGAISNTASYLRLWALSLAHSELSTVFWDKVMVAGLVKESFIFIFITWAMWATLSFAVLMVMESLSAFLHALRLHWVEFQNKFYGGDGYKFIPFSYERILNEEES